MIRQWFDSTVSGMKERLVKAVGRSGFSTTIENNWVEIVYVAGIIIMSAGIVSALATPTDQSYIIYPGRDGQSIAETVLYAMAMVLGAGGLYFSYLSGRQTVKPRLVGFFLTVGLIMIGVAIYIEMYIYFAK